MLAIFVAAVIGYVPGQVLRRDPRAAKLREQIEAMDAEARGLAAGNEVLGREVRGLSSEVRAIEDRARADLGMVYPDEVVYRVVEPPAADAPSTASTPVPAAPAAPAALAAPPALAPAPAAAGAVR